MKPEISAYNHYVSAMLMTSVQPFPMFSLKK